MTQGKRKNQINFSSRMTFIGFIGLALCIIWALNFMPEAEQPTQETQHTYSPSDSTKQPNDFFLPLEDSSDFRLVTFYWSYGEENSLDSFLVNWSTRTDFNNNDKIDYDELYVPNNLSAGYVRWNKWRNKNKKNN